MTISRGPLRVIVLAGCAVLAGAGCDKPSTEAIQRWKTTEKGPGKLMEALKNAALEPRLRAEAAAALVDIGKADDVDAAFAKIEAGERWEMLKTLVPVYTAGMKAATVDKARDARDSLFSLRAYAPPAEAKTIDDALLPSIAADLRAGRLAGGRHSVDKMLAAIGPAAGPTLAGLLAEDIPSSAAIAEILAKVGDAEARETGGAALVRRASKAKAVSPGTWRALAALGGRSATDFLGKTLQGPPREAVAAAQALQQSRQPELLPLAIKLASDANTDKALRDQMFGVIGSIGGPKAVAGLAQIIAGDKDDKVRFEAYEVAVEAARADGIGPALDAFAAAGPYKKADVEDFLVRPIERDVGKSARPMLLKVLASGSPLSRLVAVLALERVGGPAEAAAVAKLSGDAGVIKGYPATVGKEAARVASLLKTKKP